MKAITRFYGAFAIRIEYKLSNVYNICLDGKYSAEETGIRQCSSFSDLTTNLLR